MAAKIMALLTEIKKYFLQKDFAFFMVIGGINTLNGVLLSYLLSFFFQPNLAFITGYVAALIIAYYLNSFFVFHARPQIVKCLKFAVSYIPNFLIQNVVVLIFYNWLHGNRLLVYALAAAIGMPITFLILKLFAFR